MARLLEIWGLDLDRIRYKIRGKIPISGQANQAARP